MSAEGLLEGLVKPMRDHLDKLSGNTGAGTGAADAFGRASGTLTDLGGQHDTAARTALGGWYGQQAGLFQDRVAKVKSAADTLSANSTAMKTVATTATSAVTGGRDSIQGLIDEFIREARPKLQGADAAKAAGDDGAYLRAVGGVQQMAAEYGGKTAAELQKVRDALTPLVGQLGGLQKVDVGAMQGMGGQLGPSADGTTTPSSNGDGSGGETRGDGRGLGGHGGGGGGGGGYSGGGGGGGGGGGTAVGPRLPVAIPPQPGSGVGVNLPDGSSAEAPNEIAAAAVRNAMTALGTPYVWGASNPPSGTDCSGLTSWAYAGAGMEIPRHSSAQAIGASVPDASQLLPGDLVVWDGHVAMVVGNGQMIEAGDPVQINPIRTSNIGMPFLGFYRPTG